VRPSPGLPSRARALGAGLLLGLAIGAPAPAMLAAHTGAAAVAPGYAARVATALATRPLRKLGGGTLEPSALRDRVVVLNFWASWCGPCRRELPRLAELDRELSPGGRVVAVSIDADPRNAADFARRHAPGLAVYHDGPDGLARALDLPALPWTVVVGRSGEVLWSGGGADAATLAGLRTTALRAATSGTPSAGPTDGGE
jgi:thiol-disulfide isomerase/thioredoxin